MTTAPATPALSEILRSVESNLREVRDTMHYGDDLPVTFLEGSQIARCFDTVSNALLQTADAIRRAPVADLAGELVSTLRLALEALNTAPRFRVPHLDTDEQRMDSYRIAALCDRVLARAKACGL